VAGALCAAVTALDAAAGGFDLPDNGAQALGRGAAFVAKADDGTAIYYNPAGLARQRGTRLYGGANLYLHSFQFQRSGSFADKASDPLTPWGGRPFPRLTNSAGPFFSPFVALSTDFASLDRLTLAAGVFSPPMVGNRTFPLATGGAPAASRYDFVQSRSTLLLPTVAAGYRVTRWLDVGLSAHLVFARFDQTMVSYADQGNCANVEYQPCDSRGVLLATATSFAGTLGALARPSPRLAFGLSVRTPVSLNAQGTFDPQAPPGAPAPVASGEATFASRLPLLVRAGGRYVAMDGDFEVYDLELDATYERWRAAQGDGQRLRAPQLGSWKDIDTLVIHGFKDTLSVRAGGAYNLQLLEGVLALRAGAFFDSPTTPVAYTRIDVDTLAKLAGTVGVGYRRGGVAVDLGYAAVASVPRLVGEGQGEVRPVNNAQGGRPVDSKGALLPAVNEGAYKGFTHVVSLGLSVTFDELLGAPRPFSFGNPYEPGYVGAGEEAKVEAPPPAAPLPAPAPPAPPAPPPAASAKSPETAAGQGPDVPALPPDKPLARPPAWWEEPD
jgi:long-chain fatty acid transport protein